MEAETMRFRGIDHCDVHFGFPRLACARCIAGPIMDVPMAGSVKHRKPRTSIEDVRSRRLHEAAALQRIRDREIAGEEIGESPWDGIEFESLLTADDDSEGT